MRARHLKQPRENGPRLIGWGFAAAEGAPGKPRFSPVFYLADLKWAQKQASPYRKPKTADRERESADTRSR
jgi:hypothetical protein